MMRAYDELQLQRLKDPLLTYIRLSGGNECRKPKLSDVWNSSFPWIR